MNRFLHIFLLFFAVSLATSAQEIIRVTGVVKSENSKKPLYQVAIFDFFTNNFAIINTVHREFSSTFTTMYTRNSICIFISTTY